MASRFERPLQDAILTALREYKIANDGNSPTYAELAALTRSKAPNVYRAVQSMRRRGAVTINARGKIVLGGAYRPPD